MLEQPQPSMESNFRRGLVGLVYGFICVAGVLAVFFPGPCSQAVGIRRSPEKDLASMDARASKVFGILLLHGHHPLREDGAAAHELWIGEKTFCASCFGFLTGAVPSLIAISYFVFSNWTDAHLSHILYVTGLGGVVLGFLPALHRTSALTRFISSAAFVLGSCFMLIAMDLAAANLTDDLFTILLTIFWLLCRISLSHRC
jgi:hypothetical protein